VGSAAVVAAGAASVVVGSIEAVVTTGFSSTFLATFLVRLAAVFFVLTDFFATVFDFLDTLVLVPFFFAALLALRTILIVTSFPCSYNFRRMTLYRSKIGYFLPMFNSSHDRRQGVS
jgi:hypothetical protein